MHDPWPSIESASKWLAVGHLADILLAILLFADDIALFSYSASGLQKQLDVLAEFCAARGLTVNVNKTKILVFEHRKSTTPAFCMGVRTLSRSMSSNILAC